MNGDLRNWMECVGNEIIREQDARDNNVDNNGVISHDIRKKKWSGDVEDESECNAQRSASSVTEVDGGGHTVPDRDHGCDHTVQVEKNSISFCSGEM